MRKNKKILTAAAGLLLFPLGCSRTDSPEMSLEGRARASDGIVRLEFEVRGFSTTPEQEAWLRQDLLLLDSEGAIVEARPAVYEMRQPVPDPSGLTLENEIRPAEGDGTSGGEGREPGRYQAICRVTDLFTLRTAATRLNFRIR